MNRLSVLALSALLALSGCSGAATDGDDADLTAQEKDDKRTEIRNTYVGLWNGELVPESGDRPTFLLAIEAVAADTETKCGTVELGSGVGTSCITVFQTKARATLTTSDGRFTSQVAEGTLSNIEARFELPDAGYISIGEGGGGFSYGEGQLSGSIQASRK